MHALISTTLITIFITSLLSPLRAQNILDVNEIGQHLELDSRIKAGPHLSGDSYVALRGHEELDIIQFELSVSDGDEIFILSVSLGPDFVVESSRTLTAIYDFRFRRILEFDNNGIEFSNNSLFGVWHQRWAFLQNNLSVSAVIAAAGAVAVGNLSIERFWIEQRNGLNHPQIIALRAFPKPQVSAHESRGQLSITVDDVPVANVELSDLSFPSSNHATTYATWLIWSQQFHPDVASLIAGAKFLPTDIERKTRDGFGKKPIESSLSMKNAALDRIQLNAIAGRNPTIPSWEPKFTERLASLMISAARGEALNGPTSDDDYAKQIFDLKRHGQPLDIMLLSIHASFGCDEKEPEPEICNIATIAIREVLDDPIVDALINALNIDQAGQHADAAKAMIALRSPHLDRGDILDIMIANTLVEGKRGNQLDEELNKEFEKLPILFEQAFERDPYVPSRYRDYYNYLHAAASDLEGTYLVYTRAYPVIDLARSIPQVRIPKIVSAISDVEDRIAKDFPAHFPRY